MKDNVLIVSVWGYPPQWAKYKYIVHIDHQVHRNLEKSECVSCCTTLALTNHLLKKYDVKTIVFGADTVVNPSITNDIRHEALLQYNKWLEELLKPSNCNCCDSMKEKSSIIEISVLPGIGHYYGWHFEASIDNVFVQAFNKIFNELTNRSYKWIFLDLTHGLNYLLVAVLYATVANAILFDMESRLIIVNSEPARTGGNRCIEMRDIQMEKEKSPNTLDVLSILDVSRLQVVVSLIRSLLALKYFQPLQLGIILKELKKSCSQKEQELEKIEKVLSFFTLLSNTIVGPTFINSYTLDSSGKEEPLSTAICREYEKLLDNNVENEFTPKKNDRLKKVEYEPGDDDDANVGDSNSKKVKYEPTSIFKVIPIALRKIIRDVCKELVANEGDKYLIKYLSNVGKYYRNVSESIHNSLIVEETKEDLGKVIKFVVDNKDSLEKYFSSQGLISVKGAEIEINDVLYRAISFKSLNILNDITRRIRSGEISYKELDELLEINKNKTDLDKERQKITASSRDSYLDRFLRNMCAHAGLEYTSIRKVVIDVDKKDVVKIVYDKDILFKILEHGEFVKPKGKI
ncbi:MAG: TM1812 family CRISPR-associated protein [Desulfurococcaceae archaeon]